MKFGLHRRVLQREVMLLHFLSIFMLKQNLIPCLDLAFVEIRGARWWHKWSLKALIMQCTPVDVQEPDVIFDSLGPILAAAKPLLRLSQQAAIDEVSCLQ